MLPISRITAISRAPCIWVFILGTAIARITRMIEITMRSSMSVKPRRRRIVLILYILDARGWDNVQCGIRGRLVDPDGGAILSLLPRYKLVKNRQDLLAV